MVNEAEARASWRTDPPPFDPAAHPAPLVAKARAGWQRLYADERDSLVAAAQVAADLARLGAPTRLLAEVARVIEDEVRHTHVCAHVVSSLGAPPEETDPESMRAVLEGPVAERSARLCILGFAVGETLSAAGFAAAREHCHEPIAHWAYTELLRDEARHGGFGADAGAFALTRCAAGYAETLWPFAVAEMEELERRVGGPFDEAGLAREAALDGIETLERLGLLRGSISCGAFNRAIERHVVPRMQKLGLIPAA